MTASLTPHSPDASIAGGGFDLASARISQELCDVAEMAFPTELLSRTFAVQHNPNCVSPFLVRLIGKGRPMIDMKPYHVPLLGVQNQTFDVLGFGKTLGEAARAALAKANLTPAPSTNEAPR